MKIIEKDIETYLVAQVRKAGGVADKTISPGGRGYFDRIVVMPGGRVAFVEVKKPKGGRVSQHQILRHKVYRGLLADVAVCKTHADVDRLVERLTG